MLRSLVGSEMCIRDRVWVESDPELLERIVSNLIANALRYTAPGGRILVCCLLYTSDAADDLLCVDLGGRRIIKKKKNPHSNTANTNIHQHTSTQILDN